MASKSKPTGNRRGGRASDLWINPRSNLRGPDGNRAWNREGNISPESGTRFLELADIVLGTKKPPQKKKAFPAGAKVHGNGQKTERYAG